MFSVISPEVLFYFRICVFPEGRQILCNLNGPMVRCENVYHDRNETLADGKRSFEAIKILYSRGQHRVLIFGVLKFVTTSVREFQSFGSQAIQLFPLSVRQPTPNNRPD